MPCGCHWCGPDLPLLLAPPRVGHHGIQRCVRAAAGRTAVEMGGPQQVSRMGSCTGMGSGGGKGRRTEERSDGLLDGPRDGHSQYHPMKWNLWLGSVLLMSICTACALPLCAQGSHRCLPAAIPSQHHIVQQQPVSLLHVLGRRALSFRPHLHLCHNNCLPARPVSPAMKRKPVYACRVARLGELLEAEHLAPGAFPLRNCPLVLFHCSRRDVTERTFFHIQTCASPRCLPA